MNARQNCGVCHCRWRCVFVFCLPERSFSSAHPPLGSPQLSQCQVPVSEIDSDAMRCDWKSSLGYKENNTTPSAREKTRKRRVTRKEQKQDGQFCRGTHSPLHREVSVPTASTTQYLDRASCWIARFLECAPELWRVPSSTAMQQ